MRITKKCAVCGYKFTFDNEMMVDPLVAPHDESAQIYFELWHYYVEKCPKCGYASADISMTDNKKIIKDLRYQAVSEMPIIVTLEGARPNKIADYICAGMYYESIGDNLNYAKCMIQAGDLVYNEMMYWDEYIFDNSNSMGAIQNKARYAEFQKFADGLFSKGVDALENHTKEHPQDIDSLILLGGMLNTGDKMQKLKGAGILNRLKSANLSDRQKKVVKFLLGRIG